MLIDNTTKRFYFGRDHVGIIPLYWGTNSYGAVFVSSELKAIHDQVENVQQLLPGHYVSNEL
jgi:asparagine synthase (glutamine-hydrolysing)